jgi:osmotically-inducible protein OsmY
MLTKLRTPRVRTNILAAMLLAGALSLSARASPSTDNAIMDAAKASYNYRTVLDGRVDVSVSDGVVTLTGTVQDKGDKALAEDTVDNIPGVVSVDNLIKVRPEVAENSDAWIALKIHAEFLVKANVSAVNTKIEVKDGIVTLTGTAANEAQKSLTEVYARDNESVKAVRNEMVVESPIDRSGAVREVIDDASITSQIKFALLTNSATSALSTKVTTENGIVSIGGMAGSDAEKALVTKLAEDTRGVKSVVNEMTVKT